MNERSTASRKAAIYLRISQDREMDGLAIERQREDCENLARFRRWEVVETYVDQSKSATDRTAIRPDYDRMVADYQLGRFDAIICYASEVGGLDRRCRAARPCPCHGQRRCRPLHRRGRAVYTLRIDAKAKKEIRDILEKTFSINSSTVYPDIPGLASEIKKTLERKDLNLMR